ncbi:MAG: hypothetical protein JXR96_09465 [Deltaproteobacteria bacterium]|nr:hypothetical protein [Deltaproteobacteria bacterium]
MRKYLGFAVVILTVLAVGVLALNCGGGSDKECESAADCASHGENWYCDATTWTCKCRPDCEGFCCGDDGCGSTCPDNCTGGETCNETTCECEGGTTCTNGETRCNGDMVQTCQNNAWVDTADCTDTNQTCSNGQCVGGTVCEDGQRRCDGDMVQTCNNNAWVDTADCTDTNQICVNGYCEDAGCTQGQTRCNGDVVEVCNNDAWIEQEDCSDNGQTCQNGQCVGGGCTQGATRCNGTVVEVCNNNQWGEQEDCADNGQICSGGACEDAPTSELCPTGQQCTDVTGDGFMGCTENGQIPAGAMTGCDENNPCPANQVCFDDGAGGTVCSQNCGQCPTMQECDEITDDGMLGCLEGGYIPENATFGCDENTPCEGNFICYGLTGGDSVCIENCSVDGPCEPGAVRCDGLVAQECQGGVWVDVETCATDCIEGECVDIQLCPDGQSCDILVDEVRGCLEDGDIPESAPNCNPTTYECPGNMGCWQVGQELICLENCGLCPAGQECMDLTVGDGSGVHGCAINQGGEPAIPGDAQTGCSQQSPCEGNASCWNTGSDTVCLFNCSIDH